MNNQIFFEGKINPERINKLNLSTNSRNWSFIERQVIKGINDNSRYFTKAKLDNLTAYGIKKAKLIHLMLKMQRDCIETNKDFRFYSLNEWALIADCTVEHVRRVFNTIKHKLCFKYDRTRGKFSILTNPFKRAKAYIDKIKQRKEDARIWTKELGDLKLPLFNFLNRNRLQKSFLKEYNPVTKKEIHHNRPSVIKPVTVDSNNSWTQKMDELEL